MYSISEATVVLGISETTLRRLVAKGAIPFHKIGKLFRFTPNDIETYLKTTTTSPTGEVAIKRLEGKTDSTELASALLEETKGLTYGMVTLVVHIKQGVFERYTISREQSFITHKNEPENEDLDSPPNSESIYNEKIVSFAPPVKPLALI